jgi:flagellar hook-length control protein FliK
MIPSVFPMQVGPANSPNTGAAQGSTASGFGPAQAFDPSQGTSTGTSNSAFGQTPSTAGFLHVLDMLLSASPLPQAGSTSVSNLLVQTSVTTSSTDTSKTAPKEPGDTSTAPLDPSLCSGIAALLQGLGFQVRPEQISQLSPIDREQLDSALEFVSRNLQKGADATQVAECASLLLPRPWPLDDRTGAPTSTGTAVPGQETLTLPAGFVQTLDQIRSQLHASVAASEPMTATSLPQIATSTQDRGRVPTGTRPDSTQLATAPCGPSLATDIAAHTDAPPKTAVPPSAATASVAVSTDPERPANQDSDPALQVLQGLQQSTATKDPATGLVASDIQTRHLPPGGTASELIGRQVLEKVQVQLSEGRRELSLRLWPEELGEVRLSLRMTENDKVHAHMVVENDSVRQAMLDSMPQLRDALTRHGMDLEKMSVSVGQKDAGSTGSGSDDQGDGNGRSGRKSGRGGFRDEEISVAVPLTLGQDTGRRNGYNTIDLWS